MKCKKILFSVIFLIIALLFIPNIVNAESAVDNINVYLKDIVLGGNPETITYLSSPHLQDSEVTLTWYKSTNGIDYTLMEDSETFDYNVYYKVVFNKTFGEISDAMDNGWECGSLYLEIYNDEYGKVVDSKSYNGSVTSIEYVYDPIWKYKITTELEGITYDGPEYIIEGNRLSAELIPDERYRLPYDFEITDEFMVYITTGFDNITTSVYEINSGRIYIKPEDIKGDIHIVARGVEVTKIILDANGGTFTDSEQYIINDYDNENLVEPTRDGYVFKGWYTEKVGGLTIDCYLEDNQIISDMMFYAHWDKKGTTSIDFTNIMVGGNLTDLESILMEFLFEKGLFTISETERTIKDNNGKLLIIASDDGSIILADGLTTSDNLVYTLTDDEKQKLLNDNNRINYVPDVIEVIFAVEKEEDVYKIIFEANGGTFKGTDKYIIEQWNNEYYDTLTFPTRAGYTFKGYYTEKTGGIKFEMILNESGIDSDMTFYAQWEENSSEVPPTVGGEGQPDNNDNNTGKTDINDTNPGTNNNNTSTGNNPQTSDNILFFVGMLLIAVIGIIVTTKFRKYNKTK